MHRTNLLARALALVALGLFTACPGGNGTLDISALPTRINNTGQTTTLSVTVIDAAGKPGTGTVSLATTAGAFENGLKATTVTLDASGGANQRFNCIASLDAACTGTVTITADYGGKLTGQTTVTVRPPTADGGTTADAGNNNGGTDAGTDAGTIPVSGTPVTMIWMQTQCNTADCTVMGIKGSGFNELASIIFKVADGVGNPVSGATVTFTLNRPPAGTVLLGSASGGTLVTGTTNQQGLVVARVNSGGVIGSFSVHASVPGANNTQIEVDSPTLGVRGAKPANQGFTLQCLPVNIPAYISPAPPRAISVDCSVKVVDRYNNPVGSGIPVNFKTEAGSIPNSINTVAYDPTASNANEGTAVITFSTQGTFPPRDVEPLAAIADQFPFPRNAEPRYTPPTSTLVRNPRDGLVTVVAYVAGEEFFDDNNANGTYDLGETFIDQGEPFVDSNDSNAWDVGEVYIDTNNDGSYTATNGRWDATATIWTEARLLYTGAPAQILQPFMEAIYPGLPQSEWPQFFPNVAAENPQYHVPCGSPAPGGIPAGATSAVQAFFPDFQGNRVAGQGSSLSSAVATTPGRIVNSNANILDAYGFGIQRRLVHAAFIPPPAGPGNPNNLPAEPNPPEDACTSATRACKWKTLFYEWQNGYVDRIVFAGKASASDSTPCANNSVQTTVTSQGIGVVQGSRQFGTPP
jgi:hypothetical protein